MFEIFGKDKKMLLLILLVPVIFFLLYCLITANTQEPEITTIKPKGLEELQELTKEYEDTQKLIDDAEIRLAVPNVIDEPQMGELPDLKKPEGIEEAAEEIRRNSQKVEKEFEQQQQSLSGIDSGWQLPDEAQLQVNVEKPSLGAFPTLEGF